MPRTSTVCIASAYVAFGLFVVLATMSVPHPKGWLEFSSRGFVSLASGMDDAATLTFGLSRGIEQLLSRPMDLPIWTALTIVTLGVILFLRSVQMRRYRAALALLGVPVLLSWGPLWQGLDARNGVPYAGVLLGVSFALLGIGYVAQVLEHGHVVRQWRERRCKEAGGLGSTDHLSVSLAALVDETRSVRAGLDIQRGLCVDTRRVLWDWAHVVRECPPDEAGILAELGLSTDAVRDASEQDYGSDDARPLIEVDTALAHFEQTLVGYRAHGYR